MKQKITFFSFCILFAVLYFKPLFALELQIDSKGKYFVDQNKPIILKKITFKITGMGENHPELKALFRRKKPTLEKPFNQTNYETLKEALLQKAFDLGFLKTHFTTSEIRIHRQNHTAEIEIVLHTESQFLIGEIFFVGTHYSSAFLNRFVPFYAQEAYTTEKIMALQNRLSESNLFSEIEIEPRPNLDNPDDLSVPILIILKPRPKNQYHFSVGFGTDTGPRGRVSYLRRRTNHPGHTMHTSVGLSKLRKQFMSHYHILGKNPKTEAKDFLAKLNEESIRKKFSRGVSFGFSKSKRYQKIQTLSEFYYLEETYRFNPKEKKFRSHFLIPSLTLQWKQICLEKDSIPYRAQKISLQTKLGLGEFFSSTNFASIKINAKSIHPLGDNNRFILNGTLGALHAKQFEKIPISMRFFAGGDESVRGYGYQSLGPDVIRASGEQSIIGGRYLLLGSLELERFFQDKFSSALFYDTGQAMNTFKTRFAKSVGIGLRWHSPLGPLKIDLARPLNLSTQKFRIHIHFQADL